MLTMPLIRRILEGGRGGFSCPPPPPLFVSSIWPLTAEHHIIMVYARTRVLTVGMQTARKTAGTDSASLLI